MERDTSPTPEGKCGAHAKSTGEPCKKTAGMGTNHLGTGRCKFHGGSSPGGKLQGQRLHAAKARDTFGLPIEIDPATALLHEVWRTQGHVVWLGAVVAGLRKQDLAWGVTKVKHGGDDHGTTYEAKLNAYLGLYQDERKHLTRVSAEAVKAGVEEKRLTLEQGRAELVVNMLAGIFDGLELTDGQTQKLDELVPKALLMIAGGTNV